MTEPLLATEAPPTTEEPSTAPVTGDLSSPETTEQPKQTADPIPETPEEPKPGAPESYEFKTPEGLPEDVEIGAQIHDAYAKVARGLDLPQDKAQELFGETMSAIHKRAIEAQSDQTNEWIKQVKADPEIGGENHEERMGIAKKAIDQFGSDGMRELLDIPFGLGNHPGVIRMLFRVGQAISEDRFVGSNKGQTVDPTDDAAMAAKLYGNSPA